MFSESGPLWVPGIMKFSLKEGMFSETHGWAISTTVATDALVLKHHVIIMHAADQVSVVLDRAV